MGVLKIKHSPLPYIALECNPLRRKSVLFYRQTVSSRPILINEGRLKDFLYQKITFFHKCVCVSSNLLNSAHTNLNYFSTVEEVDLLKTMTSFSI